MLMIENLKATHNEIETAEIVLNMNSLLAKVDEINEPPRWRFFSDSLKNEQLVLEIPLLDTRELNENQIETFVLNIAVQVLNSAKKTEKQKLHKKQAEGIAAAKARGIKFGRKEIPVPDEFYYFRYLYEEGKITAREASQQLGISHSTFLKWNKVYIGRKE